MSSDDTFFGDLKRQHKWSSWSYDTTPVFERPDGGKLVEAKERKRVCKRCGAVHKQYCRPKEKEWQDTCYIIYDDQKEKCPPL